MALESKRIVAVPGTLCAPLIFSRYANTLAEGPLPVEVTTESWMYQAGPWDIPAVASRIGDGIRREAGGPVVLVGHSTGGAIALHLALTDPALVAGLILVNTGPHMHDHGDVDAILRTIHDDWGEDLCAAIVDRSFATPPTPGDREQLLSYARGVDRQAAIDVLSSQRSIDFTPDLPSLGCPVVVVHGIRDAVRTVLQARTFADEIPGAELVLLECGHTPPYELPDRLAAVTLRVLQQVADQ